MSLTQTLKFPDDFINKILCGECLSVMKLMPDKCVDLVFTSPPYADVKKYEDQDSIHPDKYVEWYLPIAEQIFRVLKPNGSFYLNICPKIKEGERHLFVFDLVASLKRQVGFRFFDNVIWNKKSPSRPFTSQGRRLIETFEYVFLFHKGVDYTFNTDAVRTEYTQSTLDRFRYKTFKGWCDKKGRWTGEHKFIKPNPLGAAPKDIITIPRRHRDFDHPAPFPTELAEWAVALGSNPGDIIMDPMCGTGIVAKACIKLNRNYICCDISSKYVKYAQENIYGTQTSMI